MGNLAMMARPIAVTIMSTDGPSGFHHIRQTIQSPNGAARMASAAFRPARYVPWLHSYTAFFGP